MKRTRRRRSREAWTIALGVVTAGIVTAAAVVEIGRVWRRGSAPLPSETDDTLTAAEQAVTEAVDVAVAGYQDVSSRENAMFNLLASFVVTFVMARAITYLLRSRERFGPFRNVRVGRRHIHHFVPGIVLAFVAGAAAITSTGERVEPRLAIAFGAGMGLTLDESALLLELEDVYWTDRGLLSVQIVMTVMALMGASVLGARFLRRGERLVLEEPRSANPPAFRPEAA